MFNKISSIEKKLWIRGGGGRRRKGVSQFSVENFLSHSAEKFRRGTLLCCVLESFRQRISLWIRRGGEYQAFPSKNFCLTVPKIFVGEPFSISLISGTEKVWITEGGGESIKIFRRKFFVSQCRKIS